jgi:hypothetical protein
LDATKGLRVIRVLTHLQLRWDLYHAEAQEGCILKQIKRVRHAAARA